MPIFNYICDKCNKKVKKFLEPEEAKKEFPCPNGCGILVRNPTTVSTTNKSRADNWFAVNPVEIYDDIETVREEHACPVIGNYDFESPED